MVSCSQQINGRTVIMCKARGDQLDTGEPVILETGGGGGYGPVEERDLHLIQRDLDRRIRHTRCASVTTGSKSTPWAGSTAVEAHKTASAHTAFINKWEG